MLNSLNLYSNTNINTVGGINNRACSDIKKETQNCTQRPISFSGAQYAPVGFSTTLNSPEDKEKFTAVSNALDKNTRNKLNSLLKSGKLLSTNSNDKTSTLDNLYKILTTERARGLKNETVLKETINTIYNPYIINQKFGKIPSRMMKSAVSAANSREQELTNRKVKTSDLNVDMSATCPAASVEFNIADKQAAEFARLVEGLTSPELSVRRVIKLNNIGDDFLQSKATLDDFNTPYRIRDWETAEVLLAPDRNAIIRARVQSTRKNLNQRSLVDVLMQSALMNTASQQTYNSLTDKRIPKYNDDEKGLTEKEKSYIEGIVGENQKISVTYQIVDDNLKIAGYEADLKTIKKHLLNTLAKNENVIIGYTYTDSDGVIVGGHEITIVGAQQDKNGKTTFICQDSDDKKNEPIFHSEDYLLPKIHHAGLPLDVVKDDFQLIPEWKASMIDMQAMLSNKA